MSTFKLNAKQAGRICKLTTDFPVDTIKITDSEDLPGREIWIDFRTDEGTQMGVMDEYGRLIVYGDAGGDVIAKYSDVKQ